MTKLTKALNQEYKYRYKKDEDHKSMLVLAQIENHKYQANGLTPFAQAMPDEYKVLGDAVSAYRRFYIEDKLKFAKWTRRKPPKWLNT